MNLQSSRCLTEFAQTVTLAMLVMCELCVHYLACEMLTFQPGTHLYLHVRTQSQVEVLLCLRTGDPAVLPELL
jgi:hypothetical protein